MRIHCDALDADPGNSGYAKHHIVPFAHAGLLGQGHKPGHDPAAPIEPDVLRLIVEVCREEAERFERAAIELDAKLRRPEP